MRNKLIAGMTFFFFLLIVSFFFIQAAYAEPNPVTQSSSDKIYKLVLSFDQTANGDLRDMVIDNNDNVYVVDRANRRLDKFDSRGNKLTSWSGTYFTSPMGIALGQGGQNIYVADNISILKFSKAGPGSGVQVFNLQKELYSVAVDVLGNIYAGGKNEVTKCGLDGKVISTFGKDNYIGPVFDLAVDKQNKVYVVDQQHATVLRYSQAQLTYGITDFGIGGPLTTGNDKLNCPQSVAVDKGKIYIVDSSPSGWDASTTTGIVKVFNAENGKYIESFGSFNQPCGIAIDSKGDVYVADYGRHRIDKYSKNGPPQAVPQTGSGQEPPHAAPKPTTTTVTHVGPGTTQTPPKHPAPAATTTTTGRQVGGVSVTTTTIPIRTVSTGQFPRTLPSVPQEQGVGHRY